MNNASDNVVMLRPRDSSAALENLNRITGLRFSRWPESLVSPAQKEEQANTQPDLGESGAPVPFGQAFA